MEPSKLRVPEYVSAESPDGLRRAMLLTNVEHRGQMTYTDIQHVDGVWYAWYVPIDARPVDTKELADANAQRQANQR